MQNSTTQLDSRSTLALAQFYENHEKRRMGQTNERVLLKVVKDAKGSHLESRVQNGPTWGWLDRLELIFTNHFKLKNVVEFLKDKQFADEIKPALDSKIIKHDKRLFSFKIATVFARVITPPKVPAVASSDELKSINTLIGAMSDHSCKTQAEFKKNFERRVLAFEKKGKHPDAIKLLREIYNSQYLQLEKPTPSSTRNNKTGAKAERRVAAETSTVGANSHTQKLNKQAAPIKEMTSGEFTILSRKIDSRVRTHSQMAANQYGSGLYNSGCDCFVNSIIQMLRFSPIQLPELVSKSPTLDRIRLLEEANQNRLFEGLIGIINVRNDRLQGLNQLKLDLVSRENQPEFSKAVGQVLALQPEQQDRAIELIMEAFQTEPDQIDAFFSDPLICEQQPLQTILRAIIDSSDKDAAFAKFVDVVISGIEKKSAFAELIKSYGLEDVEPEIMRFAHMKTSDREALIRRSVVEQLRKIHATSLADRRQAVSADAIQNLRQLLRLAGLDSESSHSQEDAAGMCRTVCDLIGIAPVDFNIKVDYQKPKIGDKEIPVAALERQKVVDSVVTLSIKDAENHISLAHLINANTVSEEIDPKMVARTDAATMGRLLGRALTDEEKQILEKENSYSLQTTQKLEFPADSHRPEFLSFQVKRYEYPAGEAVKLFKRIGISPEIEIGIEGQTEMAKYRLNAVSIHSGSSPRSGHYYTYVRQIVDGKPVWIEYNDSRVIMHDKADDIAKVELDIELNGYVFSYSKAN